MKRYLVLSFAALLVCGFAVQAAAVPITFIHQGRTELGQGSIDGVDFLYESFTITAQGDTDDRDPYGSGFFIDHTSASIEIDGVGTFNFITPTRTFINQSSSLVGFSREGISGLDLYNGPSDAALGPWDMTTSIGPISGIASFLQWSSSPVMTDSGVLFFESDSLLGTFEAIVDGQAPEPTTLALLAFGLLGVGVVGRSRRA